MTTNPSHLDRILELLEGERHPEVCMAAVLVLGEIAAGDEEVAARLIRARASANSILAGYIDKALEKIAPGKEAAEVDRWMRCLVGDDQRARAQAVAALEQNPRSVERLVGALLDAKTHGQSHLPMRLLIHHQRHIGAEERRALAAAAISRLEVGNTMCRPPLDIMWLTRPDEMAARLTERADDLARRKQWKAAILCLEALLERPQHATHQNRYDLGVMQLAASPMASSITERLADPALRHFQELIGHDFELVERLLADDRLDAQHLLYLGGHLLDRHGRERDIGSRLLVSLAQDGKAPAMARSAADRLTAAGIELAPRRRRPTHAGAASPRTTAATGAKKTAAGKKKTAAGKKKTAAGKKKTTAGKKKTTARKKKATVVRKKVAGKKAVTRMSEPARKKSAPASKKSAARSKPAKQKSAPKKGGAPGRKETAGKKGGTAAAKTSKRQSKRASAPMAVPRTRSSGSRGGARTTSLRGASSAPMRRAR